MSNSADEMQHQFGEDESLKGPAASHGAANKLSSGTATAFGGALESGALFLVLLAAVVLSVLVAGQAEQAELLGYTALLIVGPFAAGTASFVLARSRPRWRGTAPSEVVTVGLAGFIGLVAAAIVEQTTGFPVTGYLLPIVSAALLGLGTWVIMRPVDARVSGRAFSEISLSPLFFSLVLAISILFVAVFSPLYPGRPEFAALVGWWVEDPAIVPLFLLGWLGAVALLTFSDRLEHPVLTWLASVVPVIVSILLYDDGQFVVHDHYQPYIGSALFSRAGGIPMVDVYNVYGFLPWSLLALAYDWLPPTFGSFGVLSRVSTIAWFVTFVLTIHRLVDNKLQGAVLAVVGLLWIVTFHVYIFNMSGLPSTQGYRYFLPTLMVFVLTFDHQSRGRAVAVTVISAVSALWSAETFLFAIGPVAALALLKAVRDRSPAIALGALAQVAIGALSAHGLLALYLLVTFGQVPDYGPYFEILGHFQPGADNIWVVLINPYFGLWVPVAVVFFLPLATATRDALGGLRTDAKAWSLVPAAVLGVGQLSYFVGRSTETTLGLALVPFLIVLISWLDGYPNRFDRQTGRVRWIECGLVAAMIAAVFAFSTERFSRPYEVSKATSSVLRRCFTDVGCAPGDVLNRILWNINTFGRSMSNQDPRYAAVEGDNLQPRLIELEGFIEEFYAGGNHRIPLLVDTIHLPYIGNLALADTGNWYLWPISSPLLDFRSKKLTQRALASTALLGVNDAVIVDRERDAILAELRNLLDTLAARCKLVSIRTGDFYEVFAVEQCLGEG